MAEELRIRITAEAEQAQKELNKTQQAITNFSAKVKKVGATIIKATTAAVVAGGAAIVAITKQAVSAYSEYEQLAGGAKKIFDDIDYSRIANDASQAWKTMNLSANDYLAMINRVGASFAATMGDERGYEAAKRGMQAIADYASGTGANIGLLNEKFALITRSTASYQTICDQFSGILPQTSADFLAQAQACGYLSSEYTKLTEVPVAEYQEAVALMLERGVGSAGLLGNTAAETSKTVSGSLNGMKAAWQNLLVAIVQGNGELDGAFDALVESIGYVFDNLAPVVEQALMGIGTVIERLAPLLGEKLPALVSGVLPSLLGAITGLIKSLATSLPAMIQPVMTAIVAALPDIIEAGITLFAGLISALVQTIPQLVAAIPDIVNAIFEGFVAAAPMLKEAGIQLINMVGEGITEAGQWLTEAIHTLWTDILGGSEESWTEITTQLSETWESIKTSLSECWESIKTSLSSVWESIKTIAMAVWNGLQEFWNTWGNTILTYFQSIWNIITTVFSTAFNIISQVFKVFAALFSGDWGALWDAVKGLVEAVWNGIKDFLTALWNGISSVATSIWNALSGILSGIWNSISSTASSVWNGIKSTISNVWNGIKSAVSSAINSVRSTVSSVFNAIKGTATSIWNSIKTAITTPIEAARDKVKAVIDKIKSFFNFSWSLPKLKMPHITITGEFSLVPPSVPHFSIEWYKMGGVFDTPTLFGYGNGQIGGLGEDGAEAIVPLENNTEWLDRLAERLGEKIGNNPIVLEVDGKVFGQIACDSINGLTRQTGRLNIVMA